jgi:hypothetical protein
MHPSCVPWHRPPAESKRRIARVGDVQPVVFEVQQAGCESCAELVREALSSLGRVGEIVIDEEADSATVRLASGASVDDVNRALLEVSHGSGHAYRVKPGSWQTA